MATAKHTDKSTTSNTSGNASTSASGNTASSNESETPADAEKDPDQWVTGDESMTGPQASYLRTLAHEAGEEIDEGLTKAEASKRIDELQEQTGRGRDH